MYPKLTAEAPVKLAPVMVMVSPAVAMVGEKEIIMGRLATNVNPASEAVPPGVVTLTEPDAPLPTTAVMVAESMTVKAAAGTPPKLTAVAAVRFVPLMVTVESRTALVGVNEVMVGLAGGMNTNPALPAEPPLAVTVTCPLAPDPG